MVLAIVNNDFHYEMEKLSMAFFPETKINVIKLNQLSTSDIKDYTAEDEEIVIVELKLLPEPRVFVEYQNSKTGLSYAYDASEKEIDVNGDIELLAARVLYVVLSNVTGISPSWGVLTGIRPSKLMHKFMHELSEEQAIDYFENKFLVSPQKTKLSLNVAKAEQKIMATSRPESFSLYVSIPFCPGRCSYCSFVSSAVNTPSAQKIIPIYFENLLKEIEYSAELAKKCGIKMKSAYIGGGTPSTLNAEQIDRLLKTIHSSFDMSDCTEFTFEAGRPDTITREKLIAIRENGIDRISINPQTMSDSVLAAVGRKHTSQQIYDAYKEARDLGFKNINMDLIAGLPTDTTEGFEDSVKKVLDLDPECITVHTLAYKRSSDLSLDGGLFAHGKATAIMVDTANRLLDQHGYIPYYMYRQARSVGNLENVGFCKPSFESTYNIYMMEECHSILACGAGAVTKLKEPEGPNIERIFNFKYPYEYNNRFDEILSRKESILDFYARRGYGRI